ncbi:hypothetical protein GCM10027590_38140 [Nocardiopsis nanhaiensis]
MTRRLARGSAPPAGPASSVGVAVDCLVTYFLARLRVAWVVGEWWLRWPERDRLVPKQDQPGCSWQYSGPAEPEESGFLPEKHHLASLGDGTSRLARICAWQNRQRALRHALRSSLEPRV